MTTVRRRDARALSVINIAMLNYILRRWARLTRGGTPRRCTVHNRVEAEDRRRRGLPPIRSKIIFGSVAAAQAAAEEMRHLGYSRQRAYLCPKSKTGHAHLTTDLRDS